MPDPVPQEDEPFVMFHALQRQSVGAEASRKQRQSRELSASAMKQSMLVAV